MPLRPCLPRFALAMLVVSLATTDIEAQTPKPGRSSVFKRTPLLEVVYEARQIGILTKALGEQMQMIRHETVRRNREYTMGGGLLEMEQDTIDNDRASEGTSAFLGANRQAVARSAAVVETICPVRSTFEHGSKRLQDRGPHVAQPARAATEISRASPAARPRRAEALRYGDRRHALP